MSDPKLLAPEEEAEIRAREQAATPGPDNVSADCKSMCAVIPDLLATTAQLRQFKDGALKEVAEAIVYIERKCGKLDDEGRGIRIMDAAVLAVREIESQRAEIAALNKHCKTYAEAAECFRAETNTLKAEIADLKAKLARFESGNPELGDLSFRERLRSQLITDLLQENEHNRAKAEAQKDSARIKRPGWQASAWR